MKKKKCSYEVTQFTAHEKRVLELGFEKSILGPEAFAVRKIIDTMPFILEAAEYKFDRVICDILLSREGTIASAKMWAEKAIEDVRAKRGTPDEKATDAKT